MERYRVTGMSCAACSARVEKAVRSVEGVTDCTVSLLTNSMTVEGTAAPRAIVSAVVAAGYGASPEKGSTAAKVPEEDIGEKVLRNRLITSVILLLFLMYLSMGHRMLKLPLPLFLSDNPAAVGLAQLLLASLILVINQKFFVSGSKAVLHRAPNMDTLVAMGSSVAFLWSTYVLFGLLAALANGDISGAEELLASLWFESSAMIPTLVTVGKLLEARAKGKTTDALKGLMDLAPDTAVLLVDGAETVVSTDRVTVGSIFVLHPGSIVPVDGTVLSGNAAIDESALTGESIPVDKQAGDTVSAGTANCSGYLQCRADSVGENTMLSQIIRMVSDSSASKAPIARLADRISAVFVPTVMGIATLTAVIWLLIGSTVSFALARSISVLVISCPCALGLATPVAIMVGSGVGAKNGILFKNAAALETAGRINAVALDKTGTLTEGNPGVTDVLPAEGVSKEKLLAAAAAVEQYSEHPLAKAVLAESAARGIVPAKVEAFTAYAGSGVSARCEGRFLRGGREEFLELPKNVAADSEVLKKQGKTPLFFTEDGHYLGLIAVADQLKQDSSAAIAELHSLGIRTVMLTGDNPQTAETVAAELKIDEVRAGMLPGSKAEAVRALGNSGRICMIGDGINDSVALTAADLGMAIGAGTQIAMDAADVVLIRSSLSDAVTALKLGRAVLQNIRQNLFWAFFYNAIGIPIAAGVFSGLGLTLNPMLGAAAMSLSSFCVVSNALRLNLFKPFRPVGKQSAELAETPDAPEKTAESAASVPEAVPVPDTLLRIEGMMCVHCETAVRNALSAIPGVTVLAVSHERGVAELRCEAGVQEEALRAAVEAEDYVVLSVEKTEKEI